MNRSPRSSVLEDTVALLVRHFGAARVRHTLEKLPAERQRNPRTPPRNGGYGDRKEAVTNIIVAIESIGRDDPKKHRLLSDFYNDLKDRRLLPESQDIRQFSQTIGLKSISGKSRKELVSTLMRFLLDLPIERLRPELENAATISEQQRRQGFSVLTDKLLG
jgi:hypothetical protein